MPVATKLATQIARRMELVLWVLGVLCVGYLSMVALQARVSRSVAIVFAAGTGAQDDKSVGILPPDAGRVIGRLNIPQISLSVPVMSDFETSSLLKGVGHIQGTAMPGGLGTMGLAGHRDTYFQPLRYIKLGMIIDVSDQTGTYHYRVDSTEIVRPEEVRVLNVQDRPEMTLITCYPFNFIGAAPNRFIVHAHLLSASPDNGTRPSQ